MTMRPDLPKPKLTPFHNNYLCGNKYMTIWDFVNELVSIAEDYGTDTLVNCRAVQVEHEILDGKIPIKLCTFVKV